MRDKSIQPQITQKNADSKTLNIICANLCNLRLNKSSPHTTNKTLWKILEKVGA